MHQRNHYKSLEDLLADPSFSQWVRTGIDSQGWEEWAVDTPQRAALVTQARQWVLAMRVPDTSVLPEERQQAYQSTQQKISRLEGNRSSRNRSSWGQLTGWTAAAVVVIGLLFAWFYQKRAVSALTYGQLVQQTREGLLEQTNHAQHPQLITLSDGSSVLLQPGSRLSYPKRFDSHQRSVYLSGEAFFEVSKNPARPFLVYANEVVTRVVGTSFRVKAYADQSEVDVTVRTGKVQVTSNGLVSRANLRTITLLPAQGVRFSRHQLAFEKIIPVAQLSPAERSPNRIEQISFEFSDASVSQIFDTLERAYQIEIEYPREKLQGCYLTTSLSDQPLPEKLKIICASLGNDTRYELNGNTITVVSSGCN